MAALTERFGTVAAHGIGQSCPHDPDILPKGLGAPEGPHMLDLRIEWRGVEYAHPELLEKGREDMK